jgi:type II secretory pathway component GspD/PulD (secretin)
MDEGFLPTVLTNSSAPGTNTLRTGILTEPAFKNILKALEKRDHATLLNEGEVTTLSGRQAQIQIVDIKTVLNDVTATVTNKATTYDYKTTEMPFGSTLDVTPYVCADGYTIQLTVTPVVTEFLGYEDPKDYVKYDEKLKRVQFPLPKYRSRQATTSAIVWDAQTLVLGNLGDESVVAEPSGATLRQPFGDKKKKRLVVFVTPTIIDPSGNRVHSDAVSKDYYDDPRQSRSGGQ